KADRRLQVVAILPRHAQLVPLDLRLDLDLRVLDRLHHLLGGLGLDPLLDQDELADRLPAGRLDVLGVEAALRHPALGHPLAQDRQRRGRVRLVRRAEHDPLRLALEVGVRAAEVVALPELLPRRVERVVQLHQIHLGDHVERGHGRNHRPKMRPSSQPPRWPMIDFGGHTQIWRRRSRAPTRNQPGRRRSLPRPPGRRWGRSWPAAPARSTGCWRRSSSWWRTSSNGWSTVTRCTTRSRRGSCTPTTRCCTTWPSPTATCRSRVRPSWAW